MFFLPRSDAARAASQSSRDKSEVRGGEYGVSGNVGSVHAPLQGGCLATPRAPSPEKLTLISVCMCTCSAPRQPQLSTARGLCAVLLTGGCFSLCHSVSEPSSLLPTALGVLQQVQPRLSLCFSSIPALSPALEHLLISLSSAPQSFPPMGHGWLFSTTLSLRCKSPPHVPTLLL